MVRADSFTAFVIDQLRGLGVVEARAMFGGKGLYWKEQIFGLIDEGRLYFRVSETTALRYGALGSKPFEPWPGHVMKAYYELPAKLASRRTVSISGPSHLTYGSCCSSTLRTASGPSFTRAWWNIRTGPETTDTSTSTPAPSCVGWPSQTTAWR